MIGHDLNKKGKDYTGLIEVIKALGGTWWHHLDSTWIIKHPGPAATIRDALAPHIDGDDELLVAGLTGSAAWKGFNKDGADWIKNNL